VAEPMSVMAVVLEPAVVLELEPLEVLGQTATPERKDLPMRRSLLGVGLLVVMLGTTIPPDLNV